MPLCWKDQLAAWQVLLTPACERRLCFLEVLGVALAFQAGLLNVGVEGQIYAGAAAATAVGIFPLPIPGISPSDSGDSGWSMLVVSSGV